MKKNNSSKTAIIILAGITAAALLNILFAAQFAQVKSARAEFIYSTQQNANSTGGSNNNSAVAVDKNGNFVVVWESADETLTSDIYFRRFDNLGNPLSKEVRANKTAAGNQIKPAIAMDQEGNFVIAWEGNGSGDESGIFIQVYKADGTTIDSETLVNMQTEGDQTRPAVSIDYDGGEPASGNAKRMVVAWAGTDPAAPEYEEDIYYQLYDIDFTVTSGSINSINSNQRVNSMREGLQTDPSAAINTFGEFIVSWDGIGIHQEQTLGNQIWIQAYDHDGTDQKTSSLRGGNVRINSNNLNFASRSMVVADKSDQPITGGNFIITYRGGPTITDSEIYARRIARSDETGCALNALELTVNTSQAGLQNTPQISADFLGNFTVVWHDADRNNGDIYAQSYNYTGERTGQEFHVNLNSPEPSDQYKPSIGMNASGAYIVAFSDALDYDIKYQQYGSDLYKILDEGLLNTQTIDRNQTEVDSAISPQHLALLVWADDSNSINLTMYNMETKYLIKNDVNIATAPTALSSPSVSFFKDTSGEGAGRFVVVFSGDSPSCRHPADSKSGRDIWYIEYNASGNAPDPYCHRLNLEEEDDQSEPDVSAGYYNPEGDGNIEDTFAVIYRNRTPGNASLRAAFHTGAGTTETELETCGNYDDRCNLGSAALDFENNQLLFTYNRTPNEVWAQSAAYNASAINIIDSAKISGADDVLNDHARGAILPNNQAAITFSKYNKGESPTAAQVIVKRFSMNDLSAPVDTITLGSPDNEFYSLSDITSDYSSFPSGEPPKGDMFVVWTEFPKAETAGNNNIYGQFINYISTQTGGIRKYGPPVKINLTQTGNRLLPSTEMNTLGQVIVGWEGKYEEKPGGPGHIYDDPVAGIATLLKSPLYRGTVISLEPLCTQQIEPSGRYFEVPESIIFPEATIHPTAYTSVTVSLRNNTQQEVDPIQYIQVTDLQGNSQPYSIFISTSQFTNNDGIHTMPFENLSVRNCDAPAMDDPSCIETVEGPADEFRLHNDTFNPETPDGFKTFTSDLDQFTLAEGDGKSLGKWRFFPVLKLTIPPIPPVTVPGSYNATITFTLVN